MSDSKAIRIFQCQKQCGGCIHLREEPPRWDILNARYPRNARTVRYPPGNVVAISDEKWRRFIGINRVDVLLRFLRRIGAAREPSQLLIAKHRCDLPCRQRATRCSLNAFDALK